MGCAAACNEPCVASTCPISEAAEISVSANNAPAGIAGLMTAVAGGTTAIPCEQGSGSTTVCRIVGGPGDYGVTLSAPGYQSVTLNFRVTAATTTGCDTRGTADKQMLSEFLQPGNA